MKYWMNNLSNVRLPWLLQIIFALAILPGLACSAEAPAVGIEQANSLDVLLQRAKTAKERTDKRSDLEEQEKTDVLASYSEAIHTLESIQEYQKKELVFQKIIETGADQAKVLEKRIKQFENSQHKDKALKSNLALVDAEQKLIKTRSEHAALESRQVEIQHLLNELQSRPTQTREQLTRARKELLELGKQLLTLPGASESPRQKEAHRLRLNAREMAREQEIKMLEQEMLSLPVQVNLLTLEHDLLQLQLLSTSSWLKKIESFVARQEQAEALAAQEETEIAEEKASDKHPAILKIAERNAKLSQEIVGITESMGNLRAKQESHHKQAKQIEQDFRGSKQRLEIAGLSDASGQFMSAERQKLPDLRQYQKGEKRLRKKIQKAAIEQLHLDEKHAELDDIESRADEIIQLDVDTSLAVEKQVEIRSELITLLKSQRELLKRGSDSYTKYIRDLNTLDFTHRRLVETSSQYREFIDGHLLWLPSAEPANSQTLKDLLVALTWITSAESWKKTGNIFLQELLSTPWVTALFVLVFVGLLAIGSPLHAAVKRSAERIQSPYSDRFIFTLQALLLTILIALPLPLLATFAGWQLGRAEDSFEFAKSVASGLSKIAMPLFLLRLLVNLCKAQGIAVQHLHWDRHLVALLHKNLYWLVWLVLPLLFVSAFTKSATEASYYSSLGRLSLVIVSIAQSVFIYWVLHPTRGVPKSVLQKNPHGWLMALRHIWYPLMVLWPLIMVTVALIGYQYTAARFMELYMQTFWLLLGMTILHDIMIRWLTVSNRKLALIMAREKREAEKSAEKMSVTGDGVSDSVQTPKVEFSDLSDQTRALLRILFWISAAIGIVVIWSDMFPALALLEDITLWQTQVHVGNETVLHPVTLADLASAILLGVVVIAAAKNLPGVMEMVVLRHINLERGSRYAIMTITRYLIICTGFLVVFNTVGGRWSEIQWLVAAMGVGLGFGLQEIVANFISGIILLFERPIRIGDTVTVGDVTGVVSRIQIRATTITDLDRKELLVPNKMFITDQMINWSLSDPITRLVLPVGVAYGTNTELAHSVMLETVKTLPIILQEPGPSVYFVGFGDSSLDFEVRVFVKNFEDRNIGRHEVLMHLEKALAEQNIEIPFPQRVVHMQPQES